MVPEIYKNKPFNVMIAIMCSQDLNVNPFTVMQHMSVIKGKPRWEVKFLIAMANRSGTFSIPIDWEVTGKGDLLSVKAFATLKASGVRVECSVSMQEAKADGWANNPKYKSIPELMLRYRSAGRLIDLYCPEVRLGMSTDAETEDSDEVKLTELQSPASEVQSQAVLPPAKPKTRRKADPAPQRPILGEIVETAPAVSEPEETAPAVTQASPDNAALSEDIKMCQDRLREVSEELFAIQTDPKRHEAEGPRRAELLTEREELKVELRELRSQLQG
jgi:hypothetical protein